MADVTPGRGGKSGEPAPGRSSADELPLGIEPAAAKPVAVPKTPAASKTPEPAASPFLADLGKALTDASRELAAAPDLAALELTRVKYLGRHGALSQFGETMKSLGKDARPAAGKRLNEVRQTLTAAFEDRAKQFEAQQEVRSLAGVDYSLPGVVPFPPGGLHPLTQLLDRSVQIFRRMGFALADGPDIDDEWHCFDALNTPADHPARNEADTFFLPDGRLLRTQTSTVQIRTMENQLPPVRIIAPGAAYRRDEVDATHLAQFNQLEGLCVDEGVSLADLKGTLEFFFRELFGTETQVRFRPHFFPFTEPSFEIDVKSPAIKGGAWLEVAGCGMVDPAVFDAVNLARGDRAYNPQRHTGFAFGFGLDRLALIMTGLPDIRLLIENDVRFLGQFAG